MAATYLTLVAGELLHGPDRLNWPRCLHLGRETLSERHPGAWLVEITDDEAPEELDGQHVELTFSTDGTFPPKVAGREVARF